MKYVKKDGVIKEVPDSLEGAYVSAGWHTASKEEYERTAPKVKSAREPGYSRDNPRTDN